MEAEGPSLPPPPPDNSQLRIRVLAPSSGGPIDWRRPSPAWEPSESPPTQLPMWSQDPTTVLGQRGLGQGRAQPEVLGASEGGETAGAASWQG